MVMSPRCEQQLVRWQFVWKLVAGNQYCPLSTVADDPCAEKVSGNSATADVLSDAYDSSSSPSSASHVIHNAEENAQEGN